MVRALFTALLPCLVLALALACAHEPSHVQPLHAPDPQRLDAKSPAPVNAEVRHLTYVSASWFKASGSDQRLYVLEVGPSSRTRPRGENRADYGSAAGQYKLPVSYNW
jgi:hypothetical protein